MNYLDTLHKQLDQYHLLKHPFYQAWNKGELSIDTLQIYAKEYYGHVAAFPRYISSIHSLCEKIEDRQILLENLIDEEQGAENHPELWMQFAEGLGCSREDFLTHELDSTKKLVKEYFDITRSSYASGLGALYAYERQTPEVAKSKIDGLQKFYKIQDEQTLKFFTVHMEADEWHTEECANLLEKMNSEEQQIALEGAVKGAQLLWNFLDEMQEIHLKN
ncbi:MAG: CADD family putative folate metabolism protein [Rickettsiaceae bacterium]|nr:CADD family putative folate metabolism protein [Rickettsiaceae bacterium]MDP5083212.1 CADD family putative folate metabolism protein [Rickettsiaceae bacterium]